MEKVIKKGLITVILLFLVPVIAISQQVTGQVTYYDFLPLDGITVKLVKNNGTIIGTTTTNSTGYYTFNDVPNGTYSVECETSLPPNGVNMEDAYLVDLYLNDLYPLNDVQLLAADANGNGSVQPGDLALLLNYINKGTQMPVGDWVFTDANAAVPDRDIPWSKSASAGDVNGTYVPEKRLMKSVYLDNSVDNIQARLGEPFELILRSQEIYNITGMHIVMQIPQGIEVLGVETFDNVDYIQNIDSKNNLFKLTYLDKTLNGKTVKSGDAILKLKLSIHGNYSNVEDFSFNIDNESHFIDNNGEIIKSINLSLPKIKVLRGENSFKNSIDEQINISIFPNPVISNTNFKYYLPEEGRVKLTLYNSAGQLVEVLLDEFQGEGSHTIKFNASELMPGIYPYKIEFMGDDKLISSGSMIKSK